MSIITKNKLMVIRSVMSPDANGAHAGEMTPVANTILDGVVLVHLPEPDYSGSIFEDLSLFHCKEA